MEIKTNAGTYEIEFTVASLKRMEMSGLRPLKTLSTVSDDPMGMPYTEIIKMLEQCARLVTEGSEPTKGLEGDMLDYGYGFADILSVFSEVFGKADFLTRRLLNLAPSESVSPVERIGSADDT